MPDGWVEEFAPAKINLTLHVTGQRPDGYHLLDSLVVFANVGDILRLRPADKTTLSVTGPMANTVPADEKNLVWQAAKWFGTPPVEIVLEKALPPASGIGGGSADAAATLRALSRLFAMPLPAPSEAAQLGADVPVCLAGQPSRMRGIGDEIEFIDDFPDIQLLLVNPGVALQTPAVFNALPDKQNPTMGHQPGGAGSAQDVLKWAAGQRNDLEAPAQRLQPVIADVLQELRASGAQLVRMSGSGATCLAASQRQGDITLAEALIRHAFPEFWVAKCETLRV